MWVETQFNFARTLLLGVGLWPYEESIIARLQVIIIFSIFMSSIVFQLTAFATSKFTPQIVIEILSSVTFFSLFIIKYNSYIFKKNSVKNLIYVLQLTYDELRDEDEVAIIKKYWGFATRYTKLFTLLGAIGGMCPPIFPHIVDVIFPTNQSRSYSPIQIVTEYFIDREKYVYLIMLHVNVAVYLGGLAMLATGMMNFTYFQHACGMFSIANYRMGQALIDVEVQSANVIGRKNVIYMGIIYAIDMHRKAMRFINTFMSTFDVVFFLLITISVISISLNLFRIFQGISLGHDVAKLLSPSIFLFTTYVYMFVANFMAQQIINHNNQLFVTVYNVQWYVAPVHVQRLILFMLQRGCKTYNLLIGGIFVGSLEGFATMLTASVSYFTFIYSTSQ